MLAAARLIDDFGSVAAVLAGSRCRVERASRDRLAATELANFRCVMLGVLRADALAGPVISSSDGLLEYLAAEMAGEPAERVRALFLDLGNRLISDETMFVGTLDSTSFSPREVIRRALDLNAAALIIVHNHPSGDPSPSIADLAKTREFVHAARLFGIDVHDHLVIASGGVSSLLKESGR